MRFINKLINVGFFQDLRRPAALLVFAGLFVFVVIALTFNQFTANFQNFVYQANGFLHGSVFYTTLPPSLHDSSQIGANYFWAPGPLPALLLMLLVAMFGLVPLQVYLSMALVIAVVVITYKLARQEKFSATDSLWLSLAFTFASIYLGVAFRAQAWQVSSALAAVSVLAMFWAHRNQSQPWLVGLMAAAALMTRVTAGLAFLVPVIAVIFDQRKSRAEKFKWLVQAVTPVLLAVFILLSLNFFRSGSLFDTGYSFAKVSAPLSQVRSEKGLFSLSYIPTNIYLYFLMPPLPVLSQETYQLVPPYVTANLSMSFFILSPIFLYLWRLQLNTRIKKITGSVAAFMTLVILSYYALNAWEFGPRYLVDVLPLYYLLLLSCFSDSRLKNRDRFLIAASSLANLYLFITIPWWSGV